MTTIITKNGTGVPANSSLATGELAVDPTNKKIYTSSNGTNVIEVASTTGIDDNATSTAITIDSNENVGIGTSSPARKLHVIGDGKFQDDLPVINFTTPNGTTANYYIGANISNAVDGGFRIGLGSSVSGGTGVLY